MSEFREFGKIARFSRECIVTEKIDGTNAQVTVSDDGLRIESVGSRNRFITPEADNFGFARWVKENESELLRLGPGTHFGEWWGSGIQRGYGLPKGERRFSLFNTSRWGESRPACCHVVPVLWRGNFDDLRADLLLVSLKANGSHAAPGFMKPEGIIIFHVAGNLFFKKTVEKDEEPKSLSIARGAA